MGSIFSTNLVKEGEEYASKGSKGGYEWDWGKCVIVFCKKNGVFLQGEDWPILCHRNSIVRENDFRRYASEIKELYWNSPDTLTLAKYCRIKGYGIKTEQDKDFVRCLIEFE